MPRHYTEAETLTLVEALTSRRLETWVTARLVQPVQSAHGNLYRDVDLARLALLCELDEGFALDDEALTLVMSLLDQVHELRAEMHSLMQALAQEPEEVRLRLRILIANHIKG